MSTKSAVAIASADTVLDLQNYAPFLLTTIANRWTAAASRRCLREFAVGVTEWRVLAALTDFGEATSLEIVNLIFMDPGAVSRAMRTLHDRALVAPIVGRFKGRNKPFTLTPAGVELYGRICEEAFEREHFLLRALDQGERSTLLSLLRKVHAGISEL